MISFSEETQHFWILPKLYKLCEFCSRNSLKALEEKTFGHCRPMYCEYVTFLQSFHKGILSIHWCIAQSVSCTFSMSVVFRCSFKTAIFRRFLNVAIATSNFMNQVYNSEFVPEFSASILKENNVLVKYEI